MIIMVNNVFILIFNINIVKYKRFIISFITNIIHSVRNNEMARHIVIVART